MLALVRYSSIALSLLLALLLAPAAAAKKRTMTFFQDPPSISTIAQGDLIFYQYFATLRLAEGGPAVGTLYGQTSYNEALFVGAVRVCGCGCGCGLLGAASVV